VDIWSLKNFYLNKIKWENLIVNNLAAEYDTKFNTNYINYNTKKHSTLCRRISYSKDYIKYLRILD